jgi:hypothetical protein
MKANPLQHRRSRSSRLSDSDDDGAVTFHGAVTKGSTDNVPTHFQLPSNRAIDFRFWLNLPKRLIFQKPEDYQTDLNLTDEQNFISKSYRFAELQCHQNGEIDICALYPEIHDYRSWVDACQSTDACFIPPVCT